MTGDKNIFYTTLKSQSLGTKRAVCLPTILFLFVVLVCFALIFYFTDACRNDWGSELASIHSTEDHEESSGMCRVCFIHIYTCT